MMMKPLMRTLLCLAFVATLCASCERRPLEVMLGVDVRVRLVVDWDTNYVAIYNQHPNGMTVIVWGSDGSPARVTSVNGTTVDLSLPPDTYHLIVHNETPQDFAYQTFHDYHDYHAMAMRSNRFSSVRAWDAHIDDYVQYPDPVGVTAAQFVVTDEMVGNDTIIFVWYDEWVHHGFDHYKVPTRVYTIPEVAWPMTVNLAIRAKVRRPQSIASIEGAISGMAEGFYLSRVHRTSETGTLRLVNDNSLHWSLETRGEPQDSTGYIHFTIPSFGLPLGRELLEQRRDSDNMLALHFTLTDGTVVDTTYAVGRQIRYITPEGREAEIRYRQDLYNLRLELDLSDEVVLPPSDGGDGNAGFDADVDRWDDELVDMGGF